MIFCERLDDDYDAVENTRAQFGKENHMTPLEYVLDRKIVAIARGLKPEYIVRLGHALEEGGIRLLEITYNQKAPDTWKDTAGAIEAAEKEFGDRVLVGAGTVITLEQVKMTCDAGGHYLVTPSTQPEIIHAGKAMKLGLFPGAATPTEILAAWEAGADAVKVFPAAALGPGYIKSVCAPLSHIPMMAVGGINEKNAGDYMKAGCIGLGVGGNLVNREWIENGEWSRITALAKELMKAVNEA